MSEVFVTGAAGQTGSYLVEILAAKHKVVAIFKDRSQYSHENTSRFPKSVCYECGDISDEGFIKRLFVKYRPVKFFNMAGLTSVPGSFDNPDLYIKVNGYAVGTHLTNLMKFHPKCRYINAGSSEEIDIIDDVNYEFKPRNPYSESKLLARSYVDTFKRAGLWAEQPILFNHESPRRENVFLSKKIFRAAAKAYKDRLKGYKVSPAIIGDVNSRRDWSHAYDIAKGLGILSDTQKADEPDILNSGEQRSVADFVETAFEAAGFDCMWWYNKNEGIFGLIDKDRGDMLAVQSRDLFRSNDQRSTLPHTKRFGWPKAYSFENLIKSGVAYSINEQAG